MTRTGLVVGVLGATTVAATAALVMVLITQPFTPEQMTPATASTTAPVTSEEYVDERSVSLEVVAGDAAAVGLPVAGRVTALPCTAGGTIESGTSPVSLDGVPLLALSMSTPPWRDLAIGDSGGDVTALQAELARLGFDVSADGARMGAATRTAVRALAERNGSSMPRSGVVPLTAVVWLSAPSVEVASCDVALGETVAPGAVLARTAAPLQSAHIAVLPSGLVQGARILTVDGVDLPVDEQGAITDPAALTALAGTPSYANARATRDDGQTDGMISGRLHLAEPVTVAILPPGAIATEDGATGCVATADGEALPVSIVGSQLGQTYVVFSDDATPDEIGLDAPDGASCP